MAFDSLGLMLLVDGWVSRVLSDAELMDLLPRLIRTIGMTPIGPTTVHPHPWGPSGWQMMQESHFAFDYFYQSAVTMELFSCQEFDLQQAVAMLKDGFLVQGRPVVRFLERGVGMKREAVERWGKTAKTPLRPHQSLAQPF